MSKVLSIADGLFGLGARSGMPRYGTSLDLAPNSRGVPECCTVRRKIGRKNRCTVHALHVLLALEFTAFTPSHALRFR